MKKILNASQIREIDTYTIENEPISSVDLMERAAGMCSKWIMENYNKNRPVKLFAGPGNNGGDALVVARHLAAAGYPVIVYILHFTDKFSADFQLNHERLILQRRAVILSVENENDLPTIGKGDLLIDGIFGSGLSRPVKGLPGAVIRYLNQQQATRIAIDVPSGLFAEDNSGNDPDMIFHAHQTLTFQFPKLAFFFRENQDLTGDWHVLPIGLHPDAIANAKTDYYYLTREAVKEQMLSRSKFSHKGTYGHALLIAGSYGKLGACIMAGKAALRTGAGLITTHIPTSGYTIMQTAFPEAMISIDPSDKLFTTVPDLTSFSGIATGPGLGKDPLTADALRQLIVSASQPIVFDADAINILGENKKWLENIPAGSIFTPHPKEFERLVGKSENTYHRLDLQREFCSRYKAVLIVKGAHTSITLPDGRIYFNTTGNPGMASAGSGDVLTGIVLSLLAQGYAPESAAMTGVFIHGLAADLMIQQTSQEAMIATDIIEGLKIAFNHLHQK